MKPASRFVIDTNVLVSALLTPKGHSRQVLTRVNRSGFVLQSGETFDEVEEVIYRSRFDKYVTDKERAHFLSDLAMKSIFVAHTEPVSACSDPDDDKFLALALSGATAFIVTGNTRDFPPSPFRGIPILRPAEFLEVDLAG